MSSLASRSSSFLAGLDRMISAICGAIAEPGAPSSTALANRSLSSVMLPLGAEVRVSLLARFTQSGDQAIVAPARELLDYHADRVVDVVVAGEAIHMDGRRAGGAGRPAAASADWLVGGRISKARLKSYRHGFPSSRTVQLGPLFRRSRLPQRRTTCANPGHNDGRTIPARDP